MLLPQPPRRLLADKLDFACFIAILVLCGALAVLIGTAQRTTTADSVWPLIPILPLGFWLSAMTRLRQHLEVSENEARRQRHLRTLTLQKRAFARSIRSLRSIRVAA
ncbi:MAG: hypothetical protein M3P27_07130 [Acidobacteriota bacterium]|nr:hypothetical protein [Acidobacteriota bacterium]